MNTQDFGCAPVGIDNPCVSLLLVAQFDCTTDKHIKCEFNYSIFNPPTQHTNMVNIACSMEIQTSNSWIILHSLSHIYYAQFPPLVTTLRFLPNYPWISLVHSMYSLSLEDTAPRHPTIQNQSREEKNKWQTLENLNIRIILYCAQYANTKFKMC